MIVIILLFSVLTFQTNLTDADKKQILSLLFQHEQEGTILLSPRTDPKWKTKIHLTVAEENTCDGAVGVAIGWREIKRLSAPLWLRVSYEMWPFNVENFKSDFGGQLRERWKKHGTLYLQEKQDRYWFAHLTSEPIELDFQSVELK